MILNPIVIEQIRPCAACTLTDESVEGQKQIGITSELCWQEVNRFGQIYGAEHGAEVISIEICILLEDEDLGMIIERERLFCPLIVDLKLAKFRKVLKDRYQIISKPAFVIAGLGIIVTRDRLFIWWTAHQLAIIESSQWITLRHTR